MLRIQQYIVIWLLLCCAPLAAQEQTTWIEGTGGWFEKERWTSGFPGPSTLANIPDGDVFVPVGGGDPTAFQLNLAKLDERPFGNAVLIVQDQNLLLTNNLVVAETERSNAVGQLQILQDGKRGGDLFVDSVRIGLVNGKNGFADGVVDIGGKLIVNQPFRNSLIVGQNKGDGLATGILHVAGEIGTTQAGYQEVTIGHFAGTAGDAVGEVLGTTLRNRGGSLEVGINNGSNRNSFAQGRLTLGELDGYDKANIGIAEVGSADGFVSVQSFYNVADTTLGSKVGRSKGHLSLGDEAKYFGNTLVVNRGSRVDLGAQMDVQFLNDGLATVTNRPDGRPGGIVEMTNTFTQSQQGILEFDVVGPERGEGYEALDVSDGGVLTGRVRLNFAKDYQPQAGEVFEFIKSDGEFSKRDITWDIRNPPSDLAVHFPEANGLVAEFVKPRKQNFINNEGDAFDWEDGAIWTDQVPPQSIDDIDMVNVRRQDQLVVASQRAMVRSLNIDGTASMMSLLIAGGSAVNATHDINVKSQGEIVLERGRLVANRVELGAGAILRGEGDVVGNLISRGFVGVGGSKEPGLLLVDGNFTQLSQGWLDFDVFGPELGQFDQIRVDGMIDLNGTLNINIDDIGAIGPNAEIPLLIATEGIFGNVRLKHTNRVGELPLALVPTFGPDSGGGTMMLISGSGPGILGDMNWDESVDECDLDMFALALQDVDAYTDLKLFEPSHIGDINDDGFFDVDDIRPFFDLVNGVSCTAEVLPEPGSHSLLLFGFVLLLGFRRRT